jgi:dTDP-4-dehydrorhamnose 3,5-epimerase
MQIRELSIAGAFEIQTRQFPDDRGAFWEWYRFDALAEAVGHPLDLRQGNGSVSRRGVVRGIHYADVPPSQAKYVTVVAGAVIDYIIDIRVGSPTFGSWEAVRLDAVDRRAVYLSEGLGHAFVSLEDGSTVTYLVSETFAPEREHGITPLDPTVALEFPPEAGEPILSPKDLEAPTLLEAQAADALPTWAETRAFTQSLDSHWRSRA